MDLKWLETDTNTEHSGENGSERERSGSVALFLFLVLLTMRIWNSSHKLKVFCYLLLVGFSQISKPI